MFTHMKRFLTALILFSFLNSPGAQDFSTGAGFEINQTRFRLDDAALQAISFNPHNADIGCSVHAFFTAIFAKKYLISLKPGLSILRSKSDISFNNKMDFINLGFEAGYCFKRFRITGGAEYSYLERLFSTLSSFTVDFTKDANHRHFVNPTVSVAWLINKNWSTHFRCVYFLKNIFNSGSLDVNGTIVSPVLVTPWTLGLGVNYSFQVNK